MERAPLSYSARQSAKWGPLRSGGGGGGKSGSGSSAAARPGRGSGGRYPGAGACIVSNPAEQPQQHRRATRPS